MSDDQTDKYLTLKQLHAALMEQGVNISYSSLSVLINTGDVADQLGVTGAKNARKILPDAVQVLTAFLEHFRQAHGTRTQVADMLRAFLQPHVAGNGALVPVNPVHEVARTCDPIELAWEQGRASGLASVERILTAKEAAEILQVSVSQLRRFVPPYRRIGKSSRGDRWRWSDLAK